MLREDEQTDVCSRSCLPGFQSMCQVANDIGTQGAHELRDHTRGRDLLSMSLHDWMRVCATTASLNTYCSIITSHMDQSDGVALTHAMLTIAHARLTLRAPLCSLCTRVRAWQPFEACLRPPKGSTALICPWHADASAHLVCPSRSCTPFALQWRRRQDPCSQTHIMQQRATRGFSTPMRFRESATCISRRHCARCHPMA